MLSKNKIKLIKSLSQKKYRIKENLFLAEGNKVTSEFLKSDYNIKTLVCTENFFNKNSGFVKNSTEVIVAARDEINKCSLLKNPQESLALCEIPERNFNFNLLVDDLILCLENIQDPGNLGTILRIADWFGINTICASKNTADVFNPKVVQASMGSVLKVNVYYSNLSDIVSFAAKNNIPTYGTFLEGKNIYSENLPGNGIVIMGNEGKGISEELEVLLQNKLHIPTARKESSGTIDSLNVSVATAVICSEFRRSKLAAYSK